MFLKNEMGKKKRSCIIEDFLLLHVHRHRGRCIYSRFDFHMLKPNFCPLAFCGLKMENLKMCFPVSNCIYIPSSGFLGCKPARTFGSRFTYAPVHMCTHTGVETTQPGRSVCRASLMDDM